MTARLPTDKGLAVVGGRNRHDRSHSSLGTGGSGGVSSTTEPRRMGADQRCTGLEVMVRQTTPSTRPIHLSSLSSTYCVRVIRAGVNMAPMVRGAVPI